MNLQTLKTSTLLLFCLFITACNKQEDNSPIESVSLQIEGEWLYSYEGWDADQNGIIEQEERDYNLPSTTDYYTFHSGGGGTFRRIDTYDSGYNIDDTFTWDLLADGTEITIYGLDNVYLNPLNIKATITTLSTKEFVIEFHDTLLGEVHLASFAFHKP